MKLLSAPTFMVAGVAAIGLYAVYRMTRTSGGNLPLVTGDPMKMTSNRTYRARIKVRPDNDKNLPPFIDSMDREVMKSAIEMLGFTNVKFFMSASELPSDWTSDAKSGATSASRWFEGTWRFPSMSVPRPADLELLWTPQGANVSGELDGFTMMYPKLDWVRMPFEGSGR